MRHLLITATALALLGASAALAQGTGGTGGTGPGAAPANPSVPLASLFGSNSTQSTPVATMRPSCGCRVTAANDTGSPSGSAP